MAKTDRAHRDGKARGSQQIAAVVVPDREEPHLRRSLSPRPFANHCAWSCGHDHAPARGHAPAPPRIGKRSIRSLCPVPCARCPRSRHGHRTRATCASLRFGGIRPWADSRRDSIIDPRSRSRPAQSHRPAVRRCLRTLETSPLTRESTREPWLHRWPCRTVRVCGPRDSEATWHFIYEIFLPSCY